MNKKVYYMIVSEAGASVYSASKLATEEFPEYDVSLRSAVSIARRLQDPLAELVKIEPKAIGVGQYQHDMPEARLDEVLGGTVEDCVNTVGVDLNTASASLLSYVAGLNKAIAKNVIEYREENGKFTSRKQLLKVKKLNAVAKERGQTLAQMALAWILRDGIVTSALVGVSKPEQLLDNLKAIKNVNFTCEELLVIDEIAMGKI